MANSELGKAYVQIIPSAKGISGMIKKELGGEVDSSGASLGQGLGGKIASLAIKTLAVAGIGKAIMSSINQGGELEQSLGGVETLFKDSADKVKAYAKEAYKTTGVSANEYMKNVTSFAAALVSSLGGDTDKASKIANQAMIDMGDNANKMGTNMQDIQNAYQGFAKQNYTMLDNLKLGYGGTKKEMERLLEDAQKISGIEYNIDNLGDVYEAIHVIQKELGITGTTAKEASETLQGSFAAMKASFVDTLGNLALGENIKPSLNALAETTATFLFGNFIPMFVRVLSNLPGAIISFIGTSAPIFKEQGLKLLTSLVEGIKTGKDGFIAGFKEVLDGLITFISIEIPNIISQIANFITNSFPQFEMVISELLTNVAGLLSQYLPQFIESIGVLSSGILSFIIENFPVFLDGLNSILLGIFDFIGEFVIKALNFVSSKITENLPKLTSIFNDLVSSIIDFFTDSIPKFIDTVGEIIAALIKFIAENLPKFIESGVSIVGNLIMGLVKMMPKIIDSIVNLVIDLVKAIGDNLPKFLEKGVEIISNMIKGIADNLPAILQALGEVISNLLNKLKENLPKFFEKGWEIIKHLAKALIEKMPEIVDSISRVIGSLINFIVQKLPEFINKGASIIASLIGGIIKSIPQILKAIADVLIALIRAIAQKMPDFTKGGADLIASMVRGVGSFAGKLIGAIGQLIVKMVSRISQSGRDFFTSGSNLIVNLINGVLNNVNAVYNAGASIINGLFNGLQSAWQRVMNFVSGIGNWIAQHKGPISYDRKLLIPAGLAIMEGLDEGLRDRFKDVKDTIFDINSDIEDELGNVNPSPDFDIGSYDFNIGNANNGFANNEQGSMGPVPANINLVIAGRAFKGFVEDITKLQDAEINLDLQY